MRKHQSGELNFPLLCQARITRTTREKGEKDNGEQAVKYVNHTVEMVEAVRWETPAAPNASFTDVLAILNNCPHTTKGSSSRISRT